MVPVGIEPTNCDFARALLIQFSFGTNLKPTQWPTLMAGNCCGFLESHRLTINCRRSVKLPSVNYCRNSELIYHNVCDKSSEIKGNR